MDLAPPNEYSAYGHVHFNFSQSFSAKFKKAFTEGRLGDMKEPLARLKHTSRPDIAHSLRDYSPWMANYRFGEERSGKLFLPISKGKTLQVESFRDDIRFLNSKQLPVKLTLLSMLVLFF